MREAEELRLLRRLERAVKAWYKCDERSICSTHKDPVFDAADELEEFRAQRRKEKP